MTETITGSINAMPKTTTNAARILFPTLISVFSILAISLKKIDCSYFPSPRSQNLYPTNPLCALNKRMFNMIEFPTEFENV